MDVKQQTDGVKPRSFCAARERTFNCEGAVLVYQAVQQIGSL